MTETLPTATRALDAVAAARLRQRQCALPQAPWLHAESARRMADRLIVIKRPPARVIDWSGRAGGSAQVLASVYPRARIGHLATADEGPPAPVPQAWWRRLLPGPPGSAVMAEADVPEGGFDMVWSVMALHWQQQPFQVMRAWRRALAPEGFLMFSTLGPGSLGLLRMIYQSAGWGSPMAPLVDMHDLGDMLVESGFADPVMDQDTLTLTWASPEALLAELRELGANADPDRHPGCRTSRWRKELASALGDHAGPDGRIALDFELVQGHAFRAPDAGPRVSPNTAIALDDMKSMLRRGQHRS